MTTSQPADDYALGYTDAEQDRLTFAEKRQATGGKTELIEHAGLLQRSRQRWLSLFSLGLS